MKQYNFFILAVLMAVMSKIAAMPEDPAEREALEKRFLDIIEQQKAAPPEVAIPRLGDILGKMSVDDKPELKESRTYKTAQAQLLSIPGHAEYFGREIRKLTDDEVAGIPNPKSSDRDWYIQILGQLPSAETVNVLGELLFDERDPFKDLPTDCPWTANSLKATVAIHELGLKNPPVSAKYCDAHRDLHTWQLWYEQVRAGTRTFSFEGDDKVYTINGPVAKDSGQGAKEGKPSSSASPQHAKDSSKLPLLVAFGLLAASMFAGVVMWKKRREAQHGST